MFHCQEISSIFCLSPVLRKDTISPLEAVEIDGKYSIRTLGYSLDICNIKNVYELFQSIDSWRYHRDLSTLESMVVSRVVIHGRRATNQDAPQFRPRG